MAGLTTDFKPKLITVTEAAALLNVSTSTIHGWIDKDAIPYIELPSSGAKRTYRIPLRGLISSLSGNYNLAEELESLETAARDAGIDEASAVAMTGGDPSAD